MTQAEWELADWLELPVLGSSAFGGRAVRRAFARRPGLRVRRVPDAASWAELAQASGVGLVDTDDLTGPEAVEQLGAHVMGLGRPRIVFVASGLAPPPEVRTKIAESGLLLVRLPSEDEALRALVARAVIARTRAELVAGVEAARHLPWALRRALHRVTGREIPGPGVSEARPPPRRVEELAALVGHSRSDFYRVRQRAPALDLLGLVRVWIAAQAACLKAVEGTGVEELAARMGYESRTGLTALGRSELGMPPREWNKTPPLVPLRRCVARWSEALRETSTGPSP
jgi:AraC-like DNA-binding protein